MKESVFGPFRTFTKFGENSSIGGGDIPQNGIRKNALWRYNSTSGVNFDALSPAGTFVCVIVQNFSQIRRSLAQLYRFYRFTLWGPFWGRFPSSLYGDQ